MRSHLLGFLFGAATFCIGLFTVPLEQVVYEFDEGPYLLVDLPCGSRNFSSTVGDTVTLWSCTVSTSTYPARDDFEKRSTYYNLISRSDSRSVGSYFTGKDTGYCVLRIDEGRRTDICSARLEAVLEFEKQLFPLDR